MERAATRKRQEAPKESNSLDLDDNGEIEIEKVSVPKSVFGSAGLIIGFASFFVKLRK